LGCAPENAAAPIGKYKQIVRKCRPSLDDFAIFLPKLALFAMDIADFAIRA
jgi:hypothetical protein